MPVVGSAVLASAGAQATSRTLAKGRQGRADCSGRLPLSAFANRTGHPNALQDGKCPGLVTFQG